MPLVSRLFRGDKRLAACQVNDADHVLLGTKGDFVSKIQLALAELDDANISTDEILRQVYGKSTAKSVLNFKVKRQVINRSYQTKADDIVGKMTITQLDAEMARLELKGGRRPGDGNCCGAPPGVPRPAIAPELPKPAKSLAIGNLSPPFVPSFPLPPLIKMVQLNIHFSYTIAGQRASGGKHDELFKRAFELLLPKGILLNTDSPVAHILPDYAVIDGLLVSHQFMMLNTSMRFRANVPSNFLRVIICPFDPNTEFGVTAGGADPDTGKKVPPFVLINANVINPDRCTLVHELIHTTGLTNADHDEDKASVFATSSTARSVVTDAHAFMLKNKTHYATQ